MSETEKYHDVIVIGAGVGGLYQIKRLIDLGADALLLEGDEDLGGTWYRNRYPGCRFDSESYTYGYSFSRELLDEWHWKERFSSQPENLKYLNYVAEKFDLRRHIRFNAFVEKLYWQEEERSWRLMLRDDIKCEGEYRARFVVSALGPFSAPTLPQFKGMQSFKGASFHTYWWPKEQVVMEGKRVGIVGTGATGIQVIAEISGPTVTSCSRNALQLMFSFGSVCQTSSNLIRRNLRIVFKDLCERHTRSEPTQYVVHSDARIFDTRSATSSAWHDLNVLTIVHLTSRVPNSENFTLL